MNRRFGHRGTLDLGREVSLRRLGYPCSGTRCFQTYSLLELLVSMAIITVLLSLFQPAFIKLTQSSQKMECGKKMKGLASGHMMYADDHDGYVVVAESGNNISYDDVLIPYFTGTALSQEEQELAFLPLADYGDLSQVFHCPSDPLLEGHRGGIRRSYVMSKGKPDQESISRGMSGDGWSTALHEVPVPSRVILSLEFDYDSNRVGKTRYASLENVFVQEMGDALGLHVMGSMVFNYLFVDGSVKDLYYGETLSQDPDALGHSGYMTIDPSDDPR